MFIRKIYVSGVIVAMVFGAACTFDDSSREAAEKQVGESESSSPNASRGTAEREVRAADAPAEDLSRETAKGLIREAEAVSRLRSYVRTHERAYEKGREQEYWGEKGVDRLEFTEKGREYFSRASVAVSDLYGVYLTDATNGPSLQVTGIAMEATNERRAEFEWQYRDLPTVARRFAVRGGQGTADFQLFDDGWRVTNVELEYSDSPIQLTSAEREEERSELQSISQRKSEERQRIKNMLASSKRAQETLATFDVTMLIDERTYEALVKRIVLTDVSIELIKEDGSPLGKIWLGDIEGVRVADGNVMCIKGRNGRVRLKCTRLDSEDVRVMEFPVWLEGGLIEGTWQRTPYRLAFRDESVRDRFVSEFRGALEEWRTKYSEVREQWKGREH